MNPLVATAETEFLTAEDMRGIVFDWIGACGVAPGHSDVTRALIACQVEPPRIKALAHALRVQRWTRSAIGHLILELLKERHVRAAVALHGHRHHGVGLAEARRDVAAIRQEAREMIQREVLDTVRPRPRAVPA
jgi:hypothetical protein